MIYVVTSSILQLLHRCSVSAFYKLVKRTTVTAVDPKLDLRTNIFGASDESDTLQDNLLKNRPIGVSLLIFYVVKIHWEYWEKFLPTQP